MSCLFKSLSYFVNGIDENDLRNIICNYLLTNPKIFDDLDINEITKIDSDINLNQYVSQMRNPNTWGGGIEIKSFCNIFNTKVIVHSLLNNRIIEFLPNANYNYCINILYNGNHYEPKY
jgi:ubiquitin thioesterase OTU1